MELVSIDVKGPLPAAGNGRYKFILVMIDVLSRYAWYKLLASVTSDKIIQFVDDIIIKFGSPKEIIHDNASQFTSNKFKDFLKDKGIKSQNIPIYTAKNNPVERYNRSLGEALSICLSDDKNQQKWIIYLPEIIRKLNNRRNEATQFTPYQVFFGYSESNNCLDPQQQLNDFHEKIMQEAYENSRKKFIHNQLSYNINKKTRQFNIGDIVMVRKHKLSNASIKYNVKLDIKYLPAEILKMPFSNALLIKWMNGDEALCDVEEIKQISPQLQEILKETFNRF